MSEYRWKPIEPLSDAERSIDLADIQPMGASGKVLQIVQAWAARENLRLAL
jgi:hypothetical protein